MSVRSSVRPCSILLRFAHWYIYRRHIFWVHILEQNEKVSILDQKVLCFTQYNVYHLFFDFIFSRKSSEAVSGGPNAKFGQNTPSVQCKNTNFSQINPLSTSDWRHRQPFFGRFPHESPCGPPLPRGCNLVDFCWTIPTSLGFPG